MSLGRHETQRAQLKTISEVDTGQPYAWLIEPSDATDGTQQQLELEDSAFITTRFRALLEVPKISSEQINMLLKSDSSSDREVVFIQTLWVAITLALKLYPFSVHLTVEDKFQEACIAIYEAMDSFEPKKGKFSTHAYKQAFKAIQSAYFTKERIVRIPEYLHEMDETAQKASAICFDKPLRELTNSELEQIRELIKDKSRFNQFSDVNGKLREAIRVFTHSPLSFDDDRVGEGSLYEIIADPHAEIRNTTDLDPFEELTRILEEAFPDRDISLFAAVLAPNLGLITDDFNKPVPPKEVAKLLGITIHTVKKTLKQLREKFLPETNPSS